MPAEEIGTLAQKVLQLLNERSRLIAAGLDETALTILKLDKQIATARMAQQAATGSQQGLSNLPPSIAGSAAGPLAGAGSFMPPVGSFVTPELAEQFPGMNRILNAPSPLDLALTQLLPSIFGQGGGLGGGPEPTPVVPQDRGGGQGMTMMPSGRMLPRELVSQLWAGQSAQQGGGPPMRFLPPAGTLPVPSGPQRNPRPKPKPTPRPKPKPAPRPKARRV